MRLRSEIEAFDDAVPVKGLDPDRSRYLIACYEACIPRAFWEIKGKEITHNRGVFDDIVVQYRKKLKVARHNGYSLLFTGDNGVGKSYFLSYLLTQAIKQKMSAYYTTLIQLDSDIKRGFRDSAYEDRLRLMLHSDFVAIDELGKESFKKDNYLMGRLENLLKLRYDDLQPVLIGSNISCDDLSKMYGSTFESMIEGKYQIVTLEPGDFRESQKQQMKGDMGYPE